MLNISNNSINKRINLNEYQSGKKVLNKKHSKYFNYFMFGFLILLLIILFLPWTQNIQGKGSVTTLSPNHRPQTIQSPIPGKIEEWFVQEGQQVKKGDTILRISEIKSEYFDSDLLAKTQGQIEAKNQSSDAYEGKANALKGQINALQQEQALKIQQAKNKVQQSNLKISSAQQDLVATETQLNIALQQLNRVEALQREGLKSQKEVEDKRLKWQNAAAKHTSQQNKLLESQNELQNAQLELSRISAEYSDKIAKAQGDIFTAKSSQFDTQSEVYKLQNNYENYQVRNGLLYITAPLDGTINKAIKTGIGETFKEGESLVNIMPANYELAVEIFVNPIDLPLVNIGEKARIQFDGWPAVVFSGWEGASYGTYGARVVTIENFISENGKYRILLAPDVEDQQWPEAIKVGSGTRSIFLLNDVPIWYELWRKLNGFPPDYYKPENENENKKK